MGKGRIATWRKARQEKKQAAKLLLFEILDNGDLRLKEDKCLWGGPLTIACFTVSACGCRVITVSNV